MGILDPKPLTVAAAASTYGQSVLVTAHGAKGDGVTDDKAAIDAALVALAAGGTLVFPGGKNYKTSGGHVVPVGTKVEAAGATITHTGDNICFNFNQAGSFNLKRPGGIVGANLVGNAGVNAVGVEFGNAWGLFAHNVNIGAYSAGVGIDLHNKTNWTEGSSIVAVKLDSNKIGIRFRRTTGTFSFGYTSVLDVSVNVPADGIGVDFGGTSAETVYLYNADIRASVWPLDSNAIALRIGATFNSDNIRMHFTGEVPGNAGGTNHRGLVNDGGSLKAYGHFHIKDGPNTTTLGSTRITAAYKTLDTRAGTNADEVFQGVFMPNVDVSHDAMFGYIAGTSKSVPFVSSFDQGDAFRVYSTPFDGKPSTSPMVFRVSKAGGIFPQGGASGIYHGTGNPEGAVSAQPGSIYMRSGGSLGATVWIKDTGTSTAGWAPLTVTRSGATTGRPTTIVVGLPYFDTTLGKPIWWGGAAWKDATGATV